MRNPALLAAELSGRILLMRDSAVPGYARALGVAMAGEPKRGGLAALLGRARRVLAGREEQEGELEHVTGPACSVPLWMQGEVEIQSSGWFLKDGVAVIQIDGPLMAEGFGWGETWYHGYDTLRLAWEEMAADTRVQAIFSTWRTNGGVCDDQLSQLAKFMRENRAAAGGKPMWAWVDYGYSAGYYVIAQHDVVHAARGSGVGSIGAVVGHCDVSAGLASDGIKYTAFKFGAKKTDGSPFEPLSETAAADFQAEIDQQGRWFVADVHAGRPALSEEAIIATQAGCYFGDSDNAALSSLQTGLIDAVMTERESFAALLEHLSGASPAREEDPAAPAAPAANQEKDMKRSNVLAAADRAGLSAADKAKLEAELDNAETAEDEEEESSEDDDAPTDEAGDDDAPTEETEEDEAKAVDPKVAEAVLDLPEAKGRQKLAKELAFTPGMTTKQAKRLLAASPKDLAARMEGKDPNLSGGGGSQQNKPKDEFTEGQALGKMFSAARNPRKAKP